MKSVGLSIRNCSQNYETTTATPSGTDPADGSTVRQHQHQALDQDTILMPHCL